MITMAIMIMIIIIIIMSFVKRKHITTISSLMALFTNIAKKKKIVLMAENEIDLAVTVKV